MQTKKQTVTIREILLFALPLTASGILQLLFNVADIAIIGRFSGSTSMAAIGATTALINLLVGTFIGISVGVNVLVSRYIGSNSRDKINRAIHSAFALAILLGIAVLMFGWSFSSPLLRLIGTPEDILALSELYLRIYFLGVPATVVYNFGAAVLRAFGDTKRPLFYLAVSGIVNILLNILLVAVLRMSVDGVAIATVASQYLALSCVVGHLGRAKGEKKLSGKKLRMNRDDVLKIIQIGLPAGLQTVIFNIANVIVQRAVNGFGAAVIAGNTAAGNIDSLLHMAMNAVYHAAITYTSRIGGTGHTEQLPGIFRSCLASVILIGLPLSLCGVFFAPQILELYVSRTDPHFTATINAGLVRVNHVTILYVLSGIMEVCCGMVRGMGKSWLPMIVTAVGACGVRIVWTLVVFPVTKNLALLYWCFPVSFAVTALMHFICFRYCFRQGQIT